MSRVLFLSNHFITLFSFRKELICKLLDSGNEVYLSLPEDKDNEYFEKLGCIIILTKIDRRGINPLKDIQLIWAYRKIMKQVNPDIIFSYTIKPNIYGSLVSNKYGYKQVCNITGTGATFLKKSLIQRICVMLYRKSVKNSYKVFFQNTGDLSYFQEHGMIRNNYALLPGSGCNLEQHTFKPMPSTADEVRFIFIGRVMKLKGIDEYIECAKQIRHDYPKTHFYIAGWNEELEYKERVRIAHEQGIIDYIGFRKDIDNWIEKCHCTILPSHGGEGVPNVLLESAAAGRVCIASKINGSADVIEDGKTGFLFEAGNAQDLIDKVTRFLELSDSEKKQMARAGRMKIEKEFDRSLVVEKYMEEVKKA